MTDATRTTLYWAALAAMTAATPAVSNRVHVDAANGADWVLLGVVTTVATLGVAPLVWHLLGRSDSRTRLAVTAATVGAAYALSVRIGSSALGLSTALSPSAQLTADLLVVAVGAVLLIRLVQRSRARDARRAALLEEAVALHLAREDAQEISDRVRLALVSSVEDALAPARTLLADRLATGPPPSRDHWGAIARGLRQAAEGTVRDVSRRLWSEAVPDERSTTLARAVRDIVTRQPFPVATVVLIYLLTSPTEIIARFGVPIGVANLVAGCTLIVVVLGGANRLMVRRPQRHALIFLVAVVVLQAFTPLMFVWRDLWSDVPYRVSDLVAAVVFGVLIIVLASGAGSITRSRTESEERFEHAIGSDLLEMAATNRRLAQLMRESARVLHGRVQTRLVACAVAIERAVESEDTQAFLAAMHEARDVLTVPLLEVEDAATTVRDEVERKAALWSGLCRIEVVVDDDVASDLPAEVARDVGRVVEEGLGNAVRHGGATSVAVHVRRSDGEVVIEVEDDGRGPTGGRPGLGSALLDSVSRTWELHAIPTGARLAARIAPGDDGVDRSGMSPG